MTYRSADGVMKERLTDLEREVAELEVREQALSSDCAAMNATVKDLQERFQLSGVGGAARGPTFDGISVLVIGLCVVGVLVVPAEIYIGGFVHRQPQETVVPILLLGAPGLFAAMIAWPYRNVRGYTLGASAGAVLALAAVLNVIVGFWR